MDPEGITKQQSITTVTFTILVNDRAYAIKVELRESEGGNLVPESVRDSDRIYSPAWILQVARAIELAKTYAVRFCEKHGAFSENYNTKCVHCQREEAQARELREIEEQKQREAATKLNEPMRKVTVIKQEEAAEAIKKNKEADIPF